MSRRARLSVASIPGYAKFRVYKGNPDIRLYNYFTSRSKSSKKVA